MNRQRQLAKLKKAKIAAQVESHGYGFCEEPDCGHTYTQEWAPYFLHQHHEVLRSQGGGDEPENLVLLCRSCHSKRHGINEK